jgi:hypothetical protein
MNYQHVDIDDLDVPIEVAIAELVEGINNAEREIAMSFPSQTSCMLQNGMTLLLSWGLLEPAIARRQCIMLFVNNKTRNQTESSCLTKSMLEAVENNKSWTLKYSEPWS